MEGLYAALSEAQTGTVWKELVALAEIQTAKESFGVERACGVLFFTRLVFLNYCIF